MLTIPYRSWRSLVLPKSATRLQTGSIILVLSAVCASLAIFFAPYAGAVPGSIAQEYQTGSTDVSQGALLSLVSKGGASVTLANTGNSAMLLGVAANRPLVELSGGSEDGVQVVVGGSTGVLVTDLNGKITVGDKIAPSPIDGIGMKAINSSEVIGTAQADLSSIKTVTKYFAGSNGKKVAAKVGLLPVAVNVAYYTPSTGGSLSAYVPLFLQNVANTLAGRTVSPLRVLIGTGALLLAFATVIIMLYTAIRNGVISLGRNPLASDVLRSGMIDILLTAVGILLVGGIVVAAVLVA